MRTDWNKYSRWYGKITQGEGHFYHQTIIIPKTLALFGLKPGDKVLDLACGSGVLARRLAKNIGYTGVDLAAGLINQAKIQDRDSSHNYLVADVTKPLSLPLDFTHAALILALQNIKEPLVAIQAAAQHLIKNGILVIVLNHPCFRIPRQSSWGIDEKNKSQYRRIERYLSPLEVPINMHPGQQRHSAITWSFHQPLSAYSKMLNQSGFTIQLIEEWVSAKLSVGAAARMENRSREEFPLFLTIKAIKV